MLNVYENIVFPVEIDGNTVDQEFIKEITKLLGLHDQIREECESVVGRSKADELQLQEHLQ